MCEYEKVFVFVEQAGEMAITRIPTYLFLFSPYGFPAPVCCLPGINLFPSGKKSHSADTGGGRCGVLSNDKNSLIVKKQQHV